MKLMTAGTTKEQDRSEPCSGKSLASDNFVAVSLAMNQ